MSTSSLSPIKSDPDQSTQPSIIPLPRSAANEASAVPTATNGPQSEPDEPAEPLETPSTRIKQNVKPVAGSSALAEPAKTAAAAGTTAAPSDDWQTAYVWAFIAKFHLRAKIPKLECYADYERALLEAVPNRPDDALEGILICFLNNLKPGLRNLDCENVQTKLSEYISDMLAQSTDFTVWDHEWANNEEARGSCCTSNPERMYLGRLLQGGETIEDRIDKNPIRRMQKEYKGLFELDWQDRVKLLRQLVDWQLTSCPTVRSVIDNEWKFAAKVKKDPVALDYLVHIAPLGQDRIKNRIWALDESGRLYKSGNPFKRPCHLILISRDLAELRAYTEQCRTYGETKPPRAKGSGSKGKLTAAEGRDYKKTLVGIENEKTLATKLEELIPAVEKEDARVFRQKRKLAERARFAQTVEERSTRTRRPTRHVDYSFAYDDDFDDGSDGYSNKRSRRSGRAEATYEDAGHRPIIPGERQSARVRAHLDSNDNADNGSTGTGADDATPTPAASSSAAVPTESNGFGANAGGIRKKKMKGYAWVEEYVPYWKLSEEEQAQVRTGNPAAPNDDDADADAHTHTHNGHGTVLPNGTATDEEKLEAADDCKSETAEESKSKTADVAESKTPGNGELRMASKARSATSESEETEHIEVDDVEATRPSAGLHSIEPIEVDD